MAATSAPARATGRRTGRPATGRNGATVTIAPGGVTAIEMLDVDGAADQDALVEALLHANDALARLPGFVSASVLRSSRGLLERVFGLTAARAPRSSGDQRATRRVANYVQWEDEDYLRDADRDGNLRVLVAAYRRFALAAERRLYDVRFVGHPDAGAVTVLQAGGTGVTAINEVHTTPARQGELLAFMIGVDGLAKNVPGYVSTNIHASRDGTRNLNLVQFESGLGVALGLPWVLWRVTRERPDVSLQGGVPRIEGLGTSDIHLYEIVAVMSRDTTGGAVKREPGGPPDVPRR